MQPVPGSAPLPRLESVNGRPCSRGTAARAIGRARPSRRWPWVPFPHLRGGTLDVEVAEATAGCAFTRSSSQSHGFPGRPTAAASPRRSGRRPLAAGGLARRPADTTIGCAASVRPGMEAPRRGLGAAEAAAIGGTRGGHTERGERPQAREPSVLTLSHGPWTREGDLDSSAHRVSLSPEFVPCSNLCRASCSAFRLRYRHPEKNKQTNESRSRTQEGDAAITSPWPRLQCD